METGDLLLVGAVGVAVFVFMKTQGAGVAGVQTAAGTADQANPLAGKTIGVQPSTTPSAPVGIISADAQARGISAARAEGLTDAQIQLIFDSVVRQAAQCGSSWDPATVTCRASMPL